MAYIPVISFRYEWTKGKSNVIIFYQHPHAMQKNAFAFAKSQLFLLESYAGSLVIEYGVLNSGGIKNLKGVISDGE